MQSVHPPLEQALDSGQVLSLETVARLAPGMFVEIRNPQGQPIGEVPAVAQGGSQFTPELPVHISVPAPTPTATSAPPLSSGLGPGGLFGPGTIPLANEAANYFTEPSRQANGPLFRVRASSLVGGYELILATPLTTIDSTLHHLIAIDEIVTLLALIAAVALGWLLVRIGLKPLSLVEHTATEIAGGDFSLRVPESSPKSEVGRLATAFNGMLAKIQDAFLQRDATERELRKSEERMRRFVADASHELRTPLSAVRAYAELFERGAQYRPDDLRRVLAGITSESQRMGLLIEDLMLLARLDEGRPMRREVVELVGLCSEAMDASNAVGPQWPISLKATEPVTAAGDPDRLRQVIDNLLANVRAHTPAGTTTTVSVHNSDTEAMVEVADNGPGLTPEEASKVFERFYRADNSRTREHAAGASSGFSGAGLGLAIVGSIVTAHEGSATITTTPGVGTTFVVRIPSPSSLDDLSSGEKPDEPMIVDDNADPSAQGQNELLVEPDSLNSKETLSEGEADPEVPTR